MTSVKRFRIDREPTTDELGRGAFVFSDDYSVFDWGAMPDPIPEKGASLCTMGSFTFERLAAGGVDTHYRGVVADGQVVSLEETETAPREMAIDLTVVPELPVDGREYDYDAFYAATGEHYLVPLEIVFRNSVPVGSSLRRRSEPAEYGLGFDSWPDESVSLEEPIVEFSTKFEESDRYLSGEEADRIAGRAELEELAAVARAVNREVTDRAAAAGMVHADGKIEVLYHDGDVKVADVAGTFDENRFSYDGRPVSKEVLRQYHIREQPDWTDAVAAGKAAAKERDIADWRTLVEVEPTPAPAAVVEAVSDLYCAGTNTYTGRDWFDAPPLGEAVAAVEPR